MKPQYGIHLKPLEEIANLKRDFLKLAVNKDMSHLDLSE